MNEISADPNWGAGTEHTVTRVQALLKERMREAFRSGWSAGWDFFGCGCYYPEPGDQDRALRTWEELGWWR